MSESGPVDTDAVVQEGLTRIHTRSLALIVEVARRRIEIPALLDALCGIADEAETMMLLHDEQD